MTLTIHLPPDQEKELSERAAAIGKPVDEYIQSLSQRDIEQASCAELFARASGCAGEWRIG